MTIGEIFIKLGFKVEGAKDLAAVERSVTKTTGSVTKLTIEVAAINAAFLYMIETSLKVAVALRSFALSTGLSTDELQVWQHAAAVNGIAAGDLTEAIKNLQTVQKDFALGVPKNVGVWGMLGVDPTQGNPFQVLDRLRQHVLALKDVGIARNLLSQLGLENMLPLLRSTNAEWEKWSRNFIVTAQQTEKLARLNAEWQSLKMSVSSLSVQFSAIFVPVLSVMARGLEWVAGKAAGLVRWLESASPGARVLRLWLQILAVDLLALGVALAGLIALLGTLTAVLGFVTAFVWANVAVWGPWVLLIGAIVVSVAGLVLLFQDLWVNVRGGKSAFDWLHSANLEIRALAMGLQNIIWLWDKLVAGFKMGEGAFEHIFSKLPNWALAIPSSANTAGGSSRSDTHNEINIHESVSARATGREVMRSMQELHRGALNQAPVPNY